MKSSWKPAAAASGRCAGNDAEAEEEDGPPLMNRWQLYEEWGWPFEIVQLRPFRFDPRRPGEKRYLGW